MSEHCPYRFNLNVYESTLVQTFCISEPHQVDKNYTIEMDYIRLY